MIGNNNEEFKTLVQLLFNRFGSLVLDIKTTSKLTGRCVISLRRDLAESTGIACTKMGKARGSDRVQYSIYDIASYVVGKKIKIYNM